MTTPFLYNEEYNIKILEYLSRYYLIRDVYPCQTTVLNIFNYIVPGTNQDSLISELSTTFIRINQYTNQNIEHFENWKSFKKYLKSFGDINLLEIIFSLKFLSEQKLITKFNFICKDFTDSSGNVNHFSGETVTPTPGFMQTIDITSAGIEYLIKKAS